MTVLQDIDNFVVERAILDAIRKDPQALTLIDEVCHHPYKLCLALLCAAVQLRLKPVSGQPTPMQHQHMQMNCNSYPNLTPDVPAAASIVLAAAGGGQPGGMCTPTHSSTSKSTSTLSQCITPGQAASRKTVPLQSHTRRLLS